MFPRSASRQRVSMCTLRGLICPTRIQRQSLNGKRLYIFNRTHSSRRIFYQGKVEEKEKVKLAGQGCNTITVRPTRQAELQRVLRRSPGRLLESKPEQLMLQRRSVLSHLTLEFIIHCALLPDIFRWPSGKTASAWRVPINHSDSILTLNVLTQSVPRYYFLVRRIF